MLRQNPALATKFSVLDSRKRIIHPKSGSFLAAIASDAASAHGFNAHFVCIDETHAQKGREFYDVLKTAQGSREQPFFLSITTAGHDRQSICYEEHDYSKRVRTGDVIDPTHLPVIFAAAEADDPFEESTWIKANPNFGVSIKKEYLETQAKKAAAQPSYLNSFRQLHTGVWTAQETKFFDMLAWRKCYEKIDESRLIGERCWGGLDLSDTRDLSAFALVFKPGDRFIVKVWNFVPAKSSLLDDPFFRNMAKDPRSNCTLTPGKRIDYEYIRRVIEDACQDYEVEGVAFDRFNSTWLVKELDDVTNMVEWGQGFIAMSQPTKDFERLVIEERLNHLDNPMLSWNADNASVTQDVAGNIKLVKPDWGSAKKIDGVIASVMAFGLYSKMAGPEIDYSKGVA